MPASKNDDPTVTILPRPRTASSDSFTAPRLPVDRPGRDGGRRDLNRRQRLHDLCTGALDRLLQVGLEATTVDDVVKAAGISKGNFYRYFDSKEELVATVFAPLRDELLGAMEDGASALERAADAAALVVTYQAFAARVIGLLFTHDRLVRLFLQERTGPPRAGREPILALAEAIRHHAHRMTLASRAHGLLRDVDPRISAWIVVGSVYELLDVQLRSADGLDPLLAASTLIDVILHGLWPTPERDQP